jgi:hypothetical protein
MGCYNTYSIVIGIPDDIKAKLITSLGDTQTSTAGLELPLLASLEHLIIYLQPLGSALKVVSYLDQKYLTALIMYILICVNIQKMLSRQALHTDILV